MRLSIKVFPRSSQEKIVPEKDMLHVYVRESATDGKANAAACKLIAKEHNVAKSCVSIFRGEKSRIKIIDIEK